MFNWRFNNRWSAYSAGLDMFILVLLLVTIALATPIT